MSARNQPTFLVSTCSEPTVVKINGKANYTNCSAFQDFFEQTLTDETRRRFFIDFTDCTGMDSTFLGILVNTERELHRLSGELVVGNLSEHNHKLIHNLGLDNLLTIDNESEQKLGNYKVLKSQKVAKPEDILKAHENLAKAYKGNEAKFQDVIEFLKNQVRKNKTN